ncbi:hypothetical protein NE237_023259 [Protea cynaroides]|uniref:Uncharacterized protein n=1 Tax=Protea cynaroides TaxID=273540 RepID=A0A9Q0K608_9MAGN|nr:hypothetical protein NE237_023259 [Protea cynaroides]
MGLSGPSGFRAMDVGSNSNNQLVGPWHPMISRAEQLFDPMLEEVMIRGLGIRVDQSDNRAIDPFSPPNGDQRSDHRLEVDLSTTYRVPSSFEFSSSLIGKAPAVLGGKKLSDRGTGLHADQGKVVDDGVAPVMGNRSYASIMGRSIPDVAHLPKLIMTEGITKVIIPQHAYEWQLEKFNGCKSFGHLLKDYPGPKEHLDVGLDDEDELGNADDGQNNDSRFQQHATHVQQMNRHVASVQCPNFNEKLG